MAALALIDFRRYDLNDNNNSVFQALFIFDVLFNLHDSALPMTTLLGPLVFHKMPFNAYRQVDSHSHIRSHS